MKNKKHSELVRDYETQKSKHLEKLASQILKNDERPVKKLKHQKLPYFLAAKKTTPYNELDIHKFFSSLEKIEKNKAVPGNNEIEEENILFVDSNISESDLIAKFIFENPPNF